MQEAKPCCVRMGTPTGTQVFKGWQEWRRGKKGDEVPSISGMQTKKVLMKREETKGWQADTYTYTHRHKLLKVSLMNYRQLTPWKIHEFHSKRNTIIWAHPKEQQEVNFMKNYHYIGTQMYTHNPQEKRRQRYISIPSKLVTLKWTEIILF